MILFRPTGIRELELVASLEWRAWPPRLPDQPIFYPVLSLEYARRIARDWNALLRAPCPRCVRASPCYVNEAMDVTFRRTGERRYAVVVQVGDGRAQVMDPAPGFDAHIPHDLVHYVVEAELGLTKGVFGRAARGGGTFIPVGSAGQKARDQARARRKQLRREASIRRADEERQDDMVTSERLAAVSDLFWRRRQGQVPDASRPAPTSTLSPEDAERVGRVVARLEQLASLWNALPVGGELVFTWPSAVPRADHVARVKPSAAATARR